MLSIAKIPLCYQHLLATNKKHITMRAATGKISSISDRLSTASPQVPSSICGIGYFVSYNPGEFSNHEVLGRNEPKKYPPLFDA